MKDAVILVNEQDEQIGLMPKLEAHEKGLLHRAFSVFLFNTQGQLLLQQRAFGKYHSEGLWSNTCCSHPMPEEEIQSSAHRRLMEEMGLKTELHFLYSFLYKASLDKGLTEHEIDHIFVGTTDELPNINTDEVAAWKYISIDELLTDIQLHPELYTIWFKMEVKNVLDKIKQSI
ncbi:MAG: isopentenyl-diphosphate Delta-isomerase [Chitinophagaceae bacterium]|nr:isopentenyl-diphosphate Delta-isomerase [Chitinophagaceae bacterium]